MNRFRLFFAFVAAGLITLDQIIKNWALRSLRPVGSIKIIPGLFNLSYVENRGAAFGIMQGNNTLLLVVTCIVIVTALIWVFAGRVKGKPLNALVLIILAGGIGNFIDRVYRGFVVDFLDFSAIFGFPVFNLADCCIVTGTAAVIIYMLWTESKANRNKDIGN